MKFPNIIRDLKSWNWKRNNEQLPVTWKGMNKSFRKATAFTRLSPADGLLAKGKAQ